MSMSDMTGNHDNYHHPPLDRVTLGPRTGLGSDDYNKYNTYTEGDTVRMPLHPKYARLGSVPVQ